MDAETTTCSYCHAQVVKDNLRWHLEWHESHKAVLRKEVVDCTDCRARVAVDMYSEHLDWHASHLS